MAISKSNSSKLTRLTETGLRTAVRALCRAEPRFAEVVARHGPPPLWPREPGFATLAMIILEQQVAIAAARAQYARIAAATDAMQPAAVARLGEAGLRALGVTRQKSAYLAGLARELDSGALDLHALSDRSDAEALEALDALHGVGPWTAHCYLLFALGRPDVFPAADLALMEAARRLWRLRARPTPEQLARRARRWSPHRATAARLLWHHYLSEKAAERATTTRPAKSGTGAMRRPA